MSVFLIVLIALLIFLPALRHPRLYGGRPRSPIEPGGQRPALPGDGSSRTAQPASGTQAQRADRAPQPSSDPEQALMDDYAEGRISVEEYERRLDALYRGRRGQG